MGAIRFRGHIAPHLPARANPDALPRAEDLVMTDAIDLPADQLSVPLHEPSTKAAHTRFVADLWIPPDGMAEPRPASKSARTQAVVAIELSSLLVTGCGALVS